MRSFGIILPSFWTGETGSQIQEAGSDAVILAVYLLTSPHSHMCGLYFLPKAYVESDIHFTEKRTTAAFAKLASLPSGPFAIYDEASRYVWVPNMMRYQVGKIKDGDKRIAGILRWYAALPKNPFLEAFFNEYQEELPGLTKREGATKGHIPGAKPHISVPDPVTVLEGGTGETKLEKKSYGDRGNVKLTENEHGKLQLKVGDYLPSLIERLDSYPGINPKRFNQYKDHYDVLTTWFNRDVADGKIKGRDSPKQGHSMAEIQAERERIFGKKS